MRSHVGGVAIPREGENLFVLHFNHRERVAADSDAEFVGGLARSLGAEFVLGAAESAPERISEDALRKMRLAFFASKSAELGLSAIVQGHNSGDVAETLVMRLMRGSGSEGMSAPRPLSHFRGALFARPLLRMSKAEIKKSFQMRRPNGARTRRIRRRISCATGCAPR